MPLIDAQSIRVLIDESKSFDITAAAGEGGVQPFPAVYHAQCKEQWRSLLSEGYKKLQDYFQHFAVNQVDPQKLLRYNTLLFKNVNTPIDITETEEFIFKRSSQP
jgi:molybdopterin-guanine dinucleotide biosynthesis protein A